MIAPGDADTSDERERGRSHDRNDDTGGDTSRPSTAAGIPAEAEAAVVTRIVDGDTLELRPVAAGDVLASQAVVTVRLLEIDTPETKDPSEPVQCFGPAATDRLNELAAPGTTVWVVADEELLDPYDRTLLYLWTSRNGHAAFVNLELVRSGHARAALYEPNDRYISDMRAAERRARAAGRGVWGSCAYFGEPLAQPEDSGPSSGGGVSSGVGDCDPSYPDACIPPAPPDLDCPDVSQTAFTVQGNDPHGFDADGDGVGCDG